jgi:hypothetical protein
LQTAVGHLQIFLCNRETFFNHFSHKIRSEALGRWRAVKRAVNLLKKQRRNFLKRVGGKDSAKPVMTLS